MVSGAIAWSGLAYCLTLWPLFSHFYNAVKIGIGIGPFSGSASIARDSGEN